MKEKTFCEIRSNEVNIALLYKHIKSKEHKEFENYLTRKGMAYCEVCIKETRNDEWREHSISKNHLEIEKLEYSKVCKEKHFVSGYGHNYTSYQDKCRLAADNHNRREAHKQNQEFLYFYFS